jgi:hypothetical protein
MYKYVNEVGKKMYFKNKRYTTIYTNINLITLVLFPNKLSITICLFLTKAYREKKKIY